MTKVTHSPWEITTDDEGKTYRLWYGLDHKGHNMPTKMCMMEGSVEMLDVYVTALHDANSLAIGDMQMDHESERNLYKVYKEATGESVGYYTK